MLYACSLQEIIPLNAGNIFGHEDSRPVSQWENLISETLNRVPHPIRFKSYSHPPSPSKFKPSDDAPDIEDEVALESDSDIEEMFHSLIEELNVSNEIKNGTVEERNSSYTDASVSNDNLGNLMEKELEQQFSCPKRLERVNCLKVFDTEAKVEPPNTEYLNNKLTRMLSGTERIGLSWPEPPLPLFTQHVLEKPKPPKFSKSSKTFKSFKAFTGYSSFKSKVMTENITKSEIASLVELDLEAVINRKRKPPYVRIVSKQMVGIFMTVWIRRSLRKHVHNLNVSTVGVGLMGYIGNKVSWLYCFS